MTSGSLPCCLGGVPSAGSFWYECLSGGSLVVWQLAGAGHTSHWNERSPSCLLAKKKKASRPRQIESNHHQFINSPEPPLSSVTQAIDHLGLSQPPSRGSPLFSPSLEDLWTSSRYLCCLTPLEIPSSPPPLLSSPLLSVKSPSRSGPPLQTNERDSAMRPNCGSFANSMCSARRPTCIAGLMHLFGLQRGIAVTGGRQEGRPR